MDTRQLAAFRAVVEKGSFSQAAESLGVTQSAVSQAVKALEKRLGLTLVDRSGRQVEATPDGQLVLARAQRILQLERELEGIANEQSKTLRGQFEIGASTGPGARLVPRQLVAFRNAHPDVEVILRVHATGEVIDRVLNRELELGVVGDERPHRNLTYEPYAADEVILALPVGHAHAGAVLTIDQLRAEPLVIQQPGSGIRALVERELRTLGIRMYDLNIVAELGLQESSRTAVEHGLGATFTSRGAVERELAAGLLTEARVEGLALQRHFLLVRLTNRELSRLAAAFLAFTRQATG